MGETVVSPGTWYHLAVVRDPTYNNGAAMLLLNGQPEIDYAFGGTLPWVSGAALGTIGYRSPEQALDQPKGALSRRRVRRTGRDYRLTIRPSTAPASRLSIIVMPPQHQARW